MDENYTLPHISITQPPGKRLFDVVAASILLLLALPLMAVVTLLIVIEQRGNPIFFQRRTGLGGSEFTIYKFRTMTQSPKEKYFSRTAPSAQLRITRLGAILRDTSIDELPQLFNILKGEMSLVGPRPEPADFLTRYGSKISNYHERLKMKPGLTGMVQITPLRYEPDSVGKFIKWMHYDSYYIRHWSMLLDVWVCWKTALVLLNPRTIIEQRHHFERLRGITAEAEKQGAPQMEEEQRLDAAITTHLFGDIRRFISNLISGKNISSFHHMVFTTMVVQVVMMLVSMISTILVSRTLGADGRGVLSWMGAFAGVGTTCVVLGIGTASKKYLVKMPAQTPVFILLDLIILGASLFFFLPILYYCGLLSPIAQHNYSIFLLALFMIFPLALSSLLNDILIGLGRGLHYNKLHILEKSANVSLNLGLLGIGKVSPKMMIITNMSSVILRLTVGSRYIRPYIHAFPPGAQLWEAFHVMRRLIFSSYFCNMVMYYSGVLLTIVMGLDGATSEIGYYSVAKALADSALMLPGAVATYSLPKLAQEATPEGHRRAKWHIIKLGLFTMLLIAPPAFFLPGFIVYITFGHAFMPAAQCLHIMAAGMVACGMMSLANTIIASQHREQLLTVSATALALCMTTLTFLYRHHLDAVTASYIYSATYLIGMAVSLTIALRIR